MFRISTKKALGVDAHRKYISKRQKLRKRDVI